jgi:alpha-glucosidase
MSDRRTGEACDPALGTRRARAAALPLPWAACIHQGDRLGLREVEDIPDELRQDPFWPRSGQTDKGRDGRREGLVPPDSPVWWRAMRRGNGALSR